MSITSRIHIIAGNFEELDAKIAAAITSGFQPVGEVKFHGDQLVQAVQEGTSSATFEDLSSRVDALEAADTTDEAAIAAAQLAADNAQAAADAAQTYAGKINSWATTFATKVNADSADTGGDNDYVTDPQA